MVFRDSTFKDTESCTDLDPSCLLSPHISTLCSHFRYLDTTSSIRRENAKTFFIATAAVCAVLLRLHRTHGASWYIQYITPEWGRYIGRSFTTVFVDLISYIKFPAVILGAGLKHRMHVIRILKRALPAHWSLKKSIICQMRLSYSTASHQIPTTKAVMRDSETERSSPHAHGNKLKTNDYAYAESLERRFQVLVCLNPVPIASHPQSGVLLFLIPACRTDATSLRRRPKSPATQTPSLGSS